MKEDRAYLRLESATGYDPVFAERLREAYQSELNAIAAYTYRSTVTGDVSRTTSLFFDSLASDELRYFRTLEKLILALGGDPVVYTGGDPVPEYGTEEGENPQIRQMLSESISEERTAIDRYETLMGKTSDRVVRSVLSQIIAEKHLHLRRLNEAS